jgi:YD repeat-containing protein
MKSLVKIVAFYLAICFASIAFASGNKTAIAIGTSGNANGLTEYVGIASPGTSEGDEKWVIQKMTYDANGNLIAVEYPNGNSQAKYEWDEREGYTYD